MKTIIVTGGLGFIGSNLINILCKKKYFIINIDKVTYASNFNNISKNIKNYQFYKQDINNQNFIKKILNKYNPSLIFNVAAETHVDRSIDGPKQFMDTNIYGVFNILEAIRFSGRKDKIKFYQASSSEMFGKNYDPNYKGTIHTTEEALKSMPKSVAVHSAHGDGFKTESFSGKEEVTSEHPAKDVQHEGNLNTHVLLKNQYNIVVHPNVKSIKRTLEQIKKKSPNLSILDQT